MLPPVLCPCHALLSSSRPAALLLPRCPFSTAFARVGRGALARLAFGVAARRGVLFAECPEASLRGRGADGGGGEVGRERWGSVGGRVLTGLRVLPASRSHSARARSSCSRKDKSGCQTEKDRGAGAWWRPKGTEERRMAAVLGSCFGGRKRNEFGCGGVCCKDGGESEGCACGGN